MQVRTVVTPVLEIAWIEWGPPDGWPCILGHGFPYDVHAYAEVAPMLAQAGARVLVPWLRGYGPTRFLSAETPRSGEQAALGADLLAFMDTLGIGRATLGGYDWGGRAACVVAALRPERVEALVTEIPLTFRILPAPASRCPRPKRRRSGISTGSIPSAVGAGSSGTAATSPARSGACGRRPGPSTKPPFRGARRASTPPTSSRS